MLVLGSTYVPPQSSAVALPSPSLLALPSFPSVGRVEASCYLNAGFTTAYASFLLLFLRYCSGSLLLFLELLLRGHQDVAVCV